MGVYNPKINRKGKMKVIFAAMLLIVSSSLFAQTQCTVTKANDTSSEISVMDFSANEVQVVSFTTGEQVSVSVTGERTIEVGLQKANGTLINNKGELPFTSKTVIGDSTTEVVCN